MEFEKLNEDVKKINEEIKKMNDILIEKEKLIKEELYRREKVKKEEETKIKKLCDRIHEIIDFSYVQENYNDLKEKYGKGKCEVCSEYYYLDEYFEINNCIQCVDEMCDNCYNDDKNCCIQCCGNDD